MSTMLQTTIALAVATSGNFDSSFSAAGSKLDELKKKTASLQKTSGDITKYQKMQGSLEASKTKLDAARAKVKELSLEMSRSEAPTQKMRDAFTRANEKVRDALKTVQDQRRALGELGKSLREAGVNTSNFERSQKSLTEQLGRVKSAQDRLAAAQNKYSRITSALSWGNIKNDVLTSAASMSALKVPVQVDMQFEQGMANVRAVTGSSDEEFTMLRNQAMELGASTQFSATQAANTQEALARAGMQTNTVMSVLPSVLAMAAADGMDLASAGSILSDTLGGMGVNMETLTAQEAQRYADVLANSSSMGNTNITELGEAMKIAAPVAGSQGISIEQLGAYLAVMANKGLKGSVAGQAIVGGINRIALAPKETAAALEALDVRTKTENGQMVELPEIMRQINTAFERQNLGAADRLKYMDKIFGQNYGKSMMGFLEASASGQVDTLTQRNMTEARAGRGKAAEMAAVRNDTLQGDITALGSAWEGLMIQIGHALEPINRFITQTLTEGISKVTQFMTEHKTLCEWVVRIGAAFMAWKTISTVYRYGSLLVQLPFAKLGVWLAEGAAKATLAGENVSTVGILASKAWGLVAAHPFVAVGAAAVAMGTLIYQNWDTIKETAQNCWASVQEYASVAKEYVLGAWQMVSDWWNSWTLPDVFAALSDFAGGAIENIKGMFAGLGQWIMDKVGKLNPFNWEMPSWLGGGKSGTNQVKNANAALGGYLPPEIRNAEGGIYTRPIWTWAAEDGAEAIIPLTDKSRGIPLLMQAAQALGVMPQSATNTTNANTTTSLNTLTQSPTYRVMDVMTSLTSGSTNTTASIVDAANTLLEGAITRSLNTEGGTSVTTSPTINITVNAQGTTESEDLAEMIARRVREAWQELQERQERLAYA